MNEQLSQLGTPHLLASGSKEQYKLFEEWLRVCEETHGHAADVPARLEDRPTRVIDVGTLLNPLLCLVQGKDMESPAYFALSHRWGDNPDHHLGRTLPENHVGRYQRIGWNELPLNFRDAITVTRNLNVRYLWIDSICIIQNDDQDWQRESVRMEEVYSNAKCVLAACSAESPVEGFLERPISSRPFITIQSESGGIGYICKYIDNFQRDVDEGTLNSRGWTLQERALARRTIFFTKGQAYFECGRGIHCESLMKLSK